MSRSSLSANTELILQAERLYGRYASEVVERFNLCPWAQHARATGRVRLRVFTETDVNVLDPSLRAIAEFAPETHYEVALFIYPRIDLERRRFEYFVRSLQRADAAQHPLGEQPFAMAAFHPEASAEFGSTERLIPFLRRTPDPTVQLVRRSVLEGARAAAGEGTEFVDMQTLDIQALLSAPPVMSTRQRIAEQNYQTVRRVGVAELETAFSDIQRDRRETYARLERLSMT
jgi:hypothetical protein